MPTPFLALVLLAAPVQIGDEPTLTLDARFSTQTDGFDRGFDTDAAGTVAVTVGETRSSPGILSTTHVAFARGFSRATGVESWQRLDQRADAALAVALDATGTVAYTVERTAPNNSVAGVEYLVALSTTDGSVLWDTSKVLLNADQRSHSDIDALAVSPDGTRLYRLDFFGSTPTGKLRLEAFDTSNGQSVWFTERIAHDPFEYQQSGESASLAVSPDGNDLYVTFETIGNGGAEDVHIGSWSAATGSEQWIVDYATNDVERISRPLPTADSTGVLVATHTLPPTMPLGPMRRLSAVNGSEIWSTPLDFTSWCVELSPSGASVVAGGWEGFGSPPNGTDLVLQSFDVATGVSQWSQLYVQAGTTDEPLELAFTPNGTRLFAHVERMPLMLPFDPTYQVVSVDAATGLTPLFTDAITITGNDFTTDTWLDAVDTLVGPLATIGATTVDTIQGYGNGHDPRTGVDGTTGAIAFAIVNDDDLPQPRDVVGRVWLDPNGTEALVWVSSYTTFGQTASLRIERRNLATGAVVSTFDLPSGSGSSESFDASISPTGTHVAIQRVVPVAQRVISVFELATGNLAFEFNPGPAFIGTTFAWSTDGQYLGWGSSGSGARLGAADISTGQLLWNASIASTALFFGAVSVQGIVYDESTGATYLTLNDKSTTASTPSTNTLQRRDASGNIVWSFNYNAANVVWQLNDLRTRAIEGGAVIFGGEQNTMALSPSGATLYTTDLYNGTGMIATRLGAYDVNTGALLWFTSVPGGPGINGRLVGVQASNDGRFVHVLSEGRGESALNPLRAHVVAVDVATHQVAWSRFLDGTVTRVRRLESLGNGLRLAVVATLGPDTLTGTGGYVATLDAASGAELGRAVLDAPLGGEFIDAALRDDGTFVVVGDERLDALHFDGVFQVWNTARLAQGPDVVSVSTGGAVRMVIDEPAAMAGHVYFLLGTASGTQPGTSLPLGQVLPLNSDGYTFYTQIAANSQALQTTFGTLDVAGDARMSLVVPAGLDPVFTAITLHHAAILFDPLTGDVSGVTQANALTFTP